MPNSSEIHIVQRYDRELEQLRALVLEMGERVIEQVRSALKAFGDADEALAQNVVKRDREIDELETTADDMISSVLARRSPVANDLRFVMSSSKSVAELERIGDEAAKIASLVALTVDTEAASEAHRQRMHDVRRMGEMATGALQHAMAIFDVWDESKARQVIANHQDMENAFEAILSRLMTRGLDDARAVSLAMSLVLAIKALEHIGHHTRNLAEYVSLQAKGEFRRDQGS